MHPMKLIAGAELAPDPIWDEPSRERPVGIPIYWTNRIAPTQLLHTIHQREMQVLQSAYPRIGALERTNFEWIAAFAESTSYHAADAEGQAGLLERVVRAAIARGKGTFCFGCEHGTDIYIVPPFTGVLGDGEEFEVLWGRHIAGRFGSRYEYDVVIRDRQILIDVDIDPDGSLGPIDAMLIAGPELGSDPVWGEVDTSVVRIW